MREENFAAPLKRGYPGSLFTVGRVGRDNPLQGGPLPRLLLLQEETIGKEPANAWMGLPVPLFDAEALLRDVLDAAIYTGIQDRQPARARSSAQGADDAEIASRRAITRPATKR